MPPAPSTDTGNGEDVSIAAAAALAFDAAYENGKDCVQTLGGIGFTWEHDAHVYLRRAMSLRQLTGAPDEWRIRAARAAMTGARRRLATDLPPEAEAIRAELRAFLAEVQELDAAEQRARLVAEGYITPSWPRPWGRDAGAVELLDDRGGVPRREGGASGDHGRGLGAAEPHRPRHRGAARPLDPPDVARRDPVVPAVQRTGRRLRSGLALDARATRVEGGWVLNGQKVWTSGAKEADWGICLARTDPDRPKHDGISCFMVDMRTPGIDIRPLRELTGQALFNEVFFDDVFVPVDCLVGQENDGWRCARTTLANERVFMGASNTMGAGVLGVLNAIDARGLADDRLALLDAGDLVVTGSRVGRARLPPDPAGAGRRRPVGFGSGSAQVARRPARPACARGRDDAVWCRRRGE